MKIKLDENLPVSLVTTLKRLGHDVDTVVDEQLGGSPDTDVWTACQREERFLITQDLDFSDNRRFRPGTHHGLLLLRLGSPGRQALLDRITHLFRTEETDRWDGCFVVVSNCGTPTKIFPTKIFCGIKQISGRPSKLASTRISPNRWR